MIVIVDYGMGNLRSVQKAFEKVGKFVKITDRKIEIDASSGIVLPGVGAFKDAISRLKKLNLIEVIKKNIKNGKPFLGLCLGLQLLFTESEEGGICKGLNILKGKVVRFSHGDSPGHPKGRGAVHIKVPHIGWNSINIKKKISILDGINSGTYFYFVHSYYAKPDDLNFVAAETNYGVEFCSVIHYNNIFATQFHPEKSQKYGLKIIENFSKIC